LEGAKETAAKPHNNSARAQTELKARREERHRLETLVKKVEEINNQRQAALSYAKDLEEVRRAAEQARTELEKVRAKAGSTVQYDEEEYLGAKGAFEAAEKLCNVARLQLVKIEGEVKTSKALIARSEIDLERYDEKVAKLKEAKELLLLLEESDRLLTEFRKHVNGAIRPRLAELAGEFISDLTDGRYTAVELGQDFSPTVVEDGEAKAVISGGEEDILNLCMRLALSHMLAERSGHNFSLLIMDEVFGSLDEGRRMNLLALLEKLSRRFEQIVVIIHLDDIKEGVQRTYYVDFDEASGEAVIDGQEELEAGVANL
ncbi:MAG: hypothetical protein DCC75_11385, partial [Proteobacteria bacterium]